MVQQQGIRVREGLVALGGLVGGTIMSLSPLVGSSVLDFSLDEVAMLEEAWAPESWKRRTRALVGKGKALLNLGRGKGKSKVQPASSIGPLDLSAFMPRSANRGTTTAQRRHQKRERRRDAVTKSKPPTVVVSPRSTSSKSPRAAATLRAFGDPITMGIDTRQCLEVISSPTLLESQVFWRSVGGMLALLACMLVYLLYRRFFRPRKARVHMSKRLASPRRKIFILKSKLFSKFNVMNTVIEDGPPVIDEEPKRISKPAPKRAPSPFFSFFSKADGEVKEEQPEDDEGGKDVSHAASMSNGDGGNSHNGHVHESEKGSNGDSGPEAKRVRFSAWQTEDDGDGHIQRTPFEAYELEAYDDSSSDGSYDSSEGSEEEEEEEDEEEGDVDCHGSDDGDAVSTPHSTQSQ